MRLLLFFLLLALQIHATSPSHFSWETSAYFEDSSHTQNIQSIIQKDYLQELIPYHEENIFTLGFTPSSYWLKIKLNNTSQQVVLKHLQLGVSWLDNIEVYLTQNDIVLDSWLMGDKQPYIPKYNYLLHPTIELNIPVGQSILYLKVNTVEAFIVPFQIDSPTKIIENTVKELAFISAVYGALLIIALYNLFLFFSIKEKNYLFYTLFLLSFILMNSSYNGFQYQLFLHHSLFLPSFLNALYIFTYQYFGILFVMSFFQTKINMPKIHRLLYFYIFIGLSIQIVSFMLNFEHFLHMIAVISVSIFVPLLLAISIYALKYTNQANRLFLWGIVASLIGTAITAMSVNGLLPYTFYFFHAIEFGFIIDATILSFALASKLKFMTRKLSLTSTSLHEALTNNQHILNTTLEMIVLIDLENKMIIDINSTGVNMLGYTKKEELLNQPIQKYIVKDDLYLVHDSMQREISDAYALRLIKKDYSNLYTITKGRNILVSGKKVRLTTLIDITELKEKEKLIQKEKKARQLSEHIGFENSKLSSLGEMIGNISHQWKQPLIELEYIHKYLNEKIYTNDDKVIPKLDEMGNLIEFMSTTMSNFQNFYNPKEIQTHFNISHIIDTIVALTNHSMSMQHIKLTLHLKADITLYGNANHYAQVLLSILQNSIKVIKDRQIDNPEITIRLMQISKQVYLSIEDNAQGIRISPIHHIFEAYVSQSSEDSLGMGLYMAKKIITDKFEGSIYAENTEKGAKFTIIV